MKFLGREKGSGTFYPPQKSQKGPTRREDAWKKRRVIKEKAKRDEFWKKPRLRKAQEGENTGFFVLEKLHRGIAHLALLCAYFGGGSIKLQPLAGKEVKRKPAGYGLSSERSANEVV